MRLPKLFNLYGLGGYCIQMRLPKLFNLYGLGGYCIQMRMSKLFNLYSLGSKLVATLSRREYQSLSNKFWRLFIQMGITRLLKLHNLRRPMCSDDNMKLFKPNFIVLAVTVFRRGCRSFSQFIALAAFFRMTERNIFP